MYDSETNLLRLTPHVFGYGIQECHHDTLPSNRLGPGDHFALLIDRQDRLDVQQVREKGLAPADPARRQQAVECLDREHDTRLISDAGQLLHDLISGHGQLRQLRGLQHQEPLKKRNSPRIREMDRQIRLLSSGRCRGRVSAGETGTQDHRHDLLGISGGPFEALQKGARWRL